MKEDRPQDNPSPELQQLRQELSAHKEELDLELIRRESRWVPVVLNLLQHFSLRQFSRDSKSNAAATAALWKLFSPGTAAAAGGLLVLVLTALQLLLLHRQEAKLDQQTHLMQAQTNVVLGAQLGAILEALANHTEKTCLDPSFHERLDEMAMGRCWSDLTTSTQRSQWYNCSLLQSENKWQDLPKTAKLHCPIYTDPLAQHPSFAASQARPHPSDGPFLPIPGNLSIRIGAFTRTVQPYRFLDSSRESESIGSKSDPGQKSVAAGFLNLLTSTQEPPQLMPRSLSPERGVLLNQLVRLGFELDEKHDFDFRAAYAYESKLVGIRMQRISDAMLPKAQVSGSSISKIANSDIPCGTFFNTKIGSIIGGAFDGASFSSAILPKAAQFKPKSVRHADFDQATVFEVDFLEQVSKHAIQGFEPTMWKVERRKNARSENCEENQCYLIVPAISESSKSPTCAAR